MVVAILNRICHKNVPSRHKVMFMVGVKYENGQAMKQSFYSLFHRHVGTDTLSLSYHAGMSNWRVYMCTLLETGTIMIIMKSLKNWSMIFQSQVES